MVDVAIPAAAPAAIPAAAPAPAATPFTPVATPAPDDHSWRATLVPEDVRGEKLWEDFATPADAFRGHVALVKKFGQRTEGLVKIPGADAPPEEVTAYRKAIGVPETVAEFTVDVPEALRTIVPLEAAKAFVPLFHKLNIPPAAAQQIIQGYAEFGQTLLTQRQAGFQKIRDEEKNRVGEVTFRDDSALGEQYAEREFSTELIDALNQSGMAGHPELRKFLVKRGRELREDGIIQGESVGLSRKGQAETYIEECKNPTHPANLPNDPRHQDALKKRREAYLAVHGDSPVAATR